MKTTLKTHGTLTALLALVLFGASATLPAQVSDALSEGDVDRALPAASVAIVGKGWAPTDRIPTLLSNAPALHTDVSLLAADFSSSATGYLLASAVPEEPFQVDANCWIYVSTKSFLVLGSFLTDATGSWSITAAFEVDPALIGAQVMLQAVMVSDDADAASLEVSNGLLWTIGY